MFTRCELNRQWRWGILRQWRHRSSKKWPEGKTDGQLTRNLCLLKCHRTWNILVNSASNRTELLTRQSSGPRSFNSTNSQHSRRARSFYSWVLVVHSESAFSNIKLLLMNEKILTFADIWSRDFAFLKSQIFKIQSSHGKFSEFIWSSKLDGKSILNENRIRRMGSLSLDNNGLKLRNSW